MKKYLLSLVCVCVASFFLADNLFAQTQQMPILANKAIVLFIQGDVKVKTRRNSFIWKSATVGMTLKGGEGLKTGSQSWAEVGLVTGRQNIIRVREMTEVKLINLKPIRISLLKGEVRSLVEGLDKGSTFEIETPNAVCGARGTGWDTKTDGKNTIVDAHEKNVYFLPLSGKGKKTIKQGRRGILEGPSKRIAIKRIPLEKTRDWNRWKDSLSDRGVMHKDKDGVQKRIGNIQQKSQRAQDMKKTVRDMNKAKERSIGIKDRVSITERASRDGGTY